MNKSSIPYISRILIITILISIFQSFNVVVFSEYQTVPLFYKDIENHWAKEPILKLIEADVIHGFFNDEGTLEIRPDEFITRSEMLSLLITAAGLTKKAAGPEINFSDVGEEDWFEGIVDIGVSHGITKGYPDGTFRPFNLVNRAEMTLWIAKTFGLTLGKFEGIENLYKDVNPEDWFFETLITLSQLGLMKGYPDQTFQPHNTSTRAETIAVIVKALEGQNNLKEFEDSSFEVEKTLEDITIPEEGTKEDVSLYDGIDEDTLKEKFEDTNVGEELEGTPEENLSEEINEEVEEEPINPFIHVAPEISIRKPFSYGESQIETTEDHVSVDIRIFGNPMKSATFAVYNLPGDGSRKEILKEGKGETLFVIPQGFQEYVDMKILVPNRMDGLNEVVFTVVDIYGNENKITFRFLHLKDSNGNGIIDYYERKMGVDPNVLDGDGDGLKSWEEILIFSERLSPIFYSSVGNGVSDGELDFDGDGLSNLLELRKYGTDPTHPDTDGDGLPDGVEIFEYGLDPLNLDTLKNLRTDLLDVVTGKVQNIKKKKSTLKLPENSFGVYGLSPDVEMNREFLKVGDERMEVVLKTQLLINRLLSHAQKEHLSLSFTGKFDQAMTDALIAALGVTQINAPTYREMVRRVNEMSPLTDTVPQNSSLLSYSPYAEYEGVRHIKMLLEKWRETMAPRFHALYTIPTLYEKDGTMNGVFDSLMVAHLKLFQVHNGLLGTGMVNNATMEKLLSPIDTWTTKREYIARDFLIQDSFGAQTFFKYSKEGQSPLNPVYYGQTYGVWHKEPYYAMKRGVAQNNRTVATSGCGPAAVAMIVATLKDPTIHPGHIAILSMENDFMTASSGTEGRLYPFVAREYGLQHEYSSNIHYVMGYLEKGTHLAIASLGSGHFTDGGHLITLTGVIQLPGEDFKRVVVYDPDTGNRNYGTGNGVIRSSQPGIAYAKPDILQREIAIGFWLMWD